MRDRLTGSTALAVLAVGFAACSSVPARAQNADILSRLDALERENAELKQEMQALKARLAGQPVAPAPVAPAAPAPATPAIQQLPPAPDQQASGDSAQDHWSGWVISASLGGSEGGATMSGTGIYSYNCICTYPDNFAGTQTSTTAGRRNTYGAFTSLAAGYDWPIAPLVTAGVRLETGFGLMRFGSSGGQSFVFSDSSGPIERGRSTFEADGSVTWDASILARVGYLIEPRTLVYGVAGWTGAGFNSPTLPNDPQLVMPTFGSRSAFVSGPSLGLGFEHRLSDHLDIVAEYRFTSFLPYTLPTGSTFSDASISNGVASNRTKYDLDLQTMRVGVAYRLP